jgi:VanZ family protein
MAYSDRASPLARYLLLAYALLIVYASLNPFSGWRDPGVSPFDFLLAPLPRYIVPFEVAVNIAVYTPLGFLAVLALHPRWRGMPALLLPILASVLISMSLESLQNYLPSRFPSNVDFAANSLGGAFGACMGTLFSNHLLRDEGLQALRYRLFQTGARIDLGLVLLGLWLLTLLYPGTSLFGNGDLRAVFSEPAGDLHPGEFFIRFEALVVATNTVAVGLLLALLMGRNQPVRTLFLAFIAAALVVRTICYGFLFSSQSLFDWLTPGAMFGLAAGVLAVLVAVMFERGVKIMLCGLALMAATAIVNYAPENPYFLAALATWQQGHFLNFNGFTRVLSAAWPFVAVVYVLALAGSRSRDRD